MRSRQSLTLFRLAILFAFYSAALRLHADIIYLVDGNVMMVQKAWEEAGEVKYQTSRGVQSLPRARVREIRQESPAPAPSSQRWSLAVGNEVRGAPGGTNPSGGSSGASPFSREALARLRDNLRADASDAQAKTELVYALNSVATLQLSQGDFSAALGSLNEALSVNNRNPAILWNLAIIHLRMGDYAAAEGVLRTCVEIDAKNPHVHNLLGEAYYAQEKISEAISEWTEGLQLKPDPDIAKRLEKARQEASVHDGLGVLRGTHFILRYDQKVSDYQLGQQILAKLEKLYEQLSSELTSQPPATVAVILYPNQTYFDITRAASWTGALFDGKIRVPSKGLNSITPELTAVLTHELTHSFRASLPGRGCPTWFNEGVAQFEEGKSAANDRKALTQLRRSNHLVQLSQLRGSFVGLPADAAEVAYAESLSAVEYLVSHFGRSAIRSVLDLMAQNYNFENALKTALHRSASEFEAAWEQDLTD